MRFVKTLLFSLTFFAQSAYSQLIVDFSATPLTACVGQQISFTDLSTSPGGVVSWVWDFGDGNSSLTQNPTHAYTAAGTYTVILTANNGSTSVSEVKANYILVHPLPQPSFTLSNPPCTLPASVSVSNVSPASGVSYQWNFGNGQTSTAQNPPNINYPNEGSYNVQLTVTNSSTGCTNNTSQTLNIFNYTTAFSYSPQVVCVGTPVTFTSNSSPGTNSFNWSFGNGQTSAGANPSATYNTAGTYTVTLNSQNTTIGCSGQATQTITVINAQAPSMTPSLTIGCNPQEITFINTSNFDGTFSWAFGNGNTYQGTNPPPQQYSMPQYNQFPYPESESFSVFLYSTDANGCVSGQAYPNLITIYNLFPLFEVDVYEGCEDLLSTFTDLSTSPIPGFPINAWQWNFGNGQSSNQQNPPTQTYSEGVYDVSLTISTANGCSITLDSLELIQVGIPPNVLFTVGPDTICARQTLDFVNLSSVSVPSTSDDFEYEWYIGSQGPYGEFEPNDVPVTDTGLLDITLIVYFRGCPDTLVLEDIVYVHAPLVQFSAPSILCNPAVPVEITISENSILGQIDDSVAVFWSLGDGTTYNYDSETAWQNNNQSFNHTYNNYGDYVIQQKIWNYRTGCVDSLSSALVINYFALNLNFPNDSSCVNSNTNFSWNYESILNYGPVFFYYLVDENISLGNSANSNITNPYFYAFDEIGWHQITVGATNAVGCEAIVTEPVYVAALPQAQIGDINVSGCLPSTIVFQDASTSVSGVPINGFQWTFEGETPGAGNGLSEFSINIESTGTYTISLVITDDLGCVDSTTQQLVIQEPLANFELPLVICNNGLLNLTNLSSSYEFSAWYWNGVLMSEENNPSFTISHPSDPAITFYTDEITLVVSDANGCSDEITLSVIVSSPNANFSYDLIGANVDEEGNFSCPSVFGMFTDQSDSYGAITSWNWDFGDGKSSTLQNPNNTYVFAGTYTSSLTIEDEYGCESSISFVDFLVINGPSGEFNWEPAGTLCDPNYDFQVIALNSVSQVEWFPGNSSSFISNTGGPYTYPSAGVYAPYVIITDENNCSVTYMLDTLTVFFGNLNASFWVNPTEINWGAPLLIVNESTGGIGGIVNNNWTIGSDNFNNQSPQFTYLTNDLGQVGILLIVTDSLGCIDSAWLSIFVTDNLEFPNVFSPNGDGVNDYFVIKDNAYKEYEVVILNRWGNEMSRTYVVDDNYLWDGKAQNGEWATEGVYFYVVKGLLRDGTPQQDHGYFHLVKN